MLFDVLSTIELTASAAIVAALLSFTLSRTMGGRLRAVLVLAAWFFAVAALGATAALQPDGAGVPGLGVAVALPIAALCFAFFAIPATREAMAAVPLPALITVHIVRILGVSFVLLYFAHRLPAPFAPVAGWGDVFVGVTAGPVAWIAARQGSRANGLVLAWNIIGFVDLIAAVGLGATSAPGQLQLFTGPPSSSLMTTLPWIIIPCFLVPGLQSLHIAIFYRLSRNVRRAPSRAENANTPAMA